MKRLLAISGACLVLIVGIFYFSHRYQVHKREALLTSTLDRLYEYQKSHHRFPADLSTFSGEIPDWLHYSTDSSRRHFTLAYTTGLMDWNTHRYDSRTKTWETNFND